GQRLIVWNAEPLSADHDARVGQVIAARGDDLLIRCGENSALRLLELQPESKRRMSARDFLNGTHLKVGDRFGEV
ncbi:MAG: methionyl-tRNA formyltransferase, partial [Pyrinomonadaceae bacterium]